VQRYDWPVSTGKAGYSTPSGTFAALSMNKVWYSKEWDNAPMPHAIFFMKDGHAIHGSYEVKHLGKAVSHGCVRISPQNAATLYTLVEKTGLKNTQGVLAGDTPGGEAKVAKSASSRTRHSQSAAASRTIVTSLHAHLALATMPSPSSHRKDAAAFSGACSAVNRQRGICIRIVQEHELSVTP